MFVSSVEFLENPPCFSLGDNKGGFSKNLPKYPKNRAFFGVQCSQKATGENFSGYSFLRLFRVQELLSDPSVQEQLALL